jgi:hypothetical protein
MPFVRPSPQRVATTSVVEASGGKAYHPLQATQALNPFPGSVQGSPPNVTRLIGIDFQTTTFTLTAGAGVTTFVTWPAIGFAGILAANQRVYTSGIAPTLDQTVPTGLSPLVAGQTTQVCLLCSLQNYDSMGTGILIGVPSLVTQASTASPTRTTFTGPWFAAGNTYTAFSCVPSASILTPTAVTNLKVSIGISAQLYAIFLQS